MTFRARSENSQYVFELHSAEYTVLFGIKLSVIQGCLFSLIP